MSNQATGLKIGYVPYSGSMTAVCDRRRFPQYARRRGLDFELYEPGVNYDLVVLNTQADLSYWARCPKNSALILDLPDGYLSNPLSGPVDRLKALHKFASRRWSRFENSYTDTLVRVANRVDAIVCASREQADDATEFNDSVYDILDFHGAEFSRVKSDYSPHTPFRLVWEGIGDSLYGFKTAAEGLAEVARSRPIELHVLTDLRFRPINRPFTLCSSKLMQQVLPGVNCYLYQWNLAFFNEIVTGCDLAVIPMAPESRMIRVKPENRLLLFWKMGLPVVTSDTPSFDRVTRLAGEASCADKSEWFKNVTRMIDNEELRKQNARNGLKYIETHASDHILDHKWDQVLEGVIRMA